jgi:hypothetical protein
MHQPAASAMRKQNLGVITYGYRALKYEFFFHLAAQNIFFFTLQTLRILRFAQDGFAAL